MTTVIEAIYEDGVLRPLETEGLKERHRYRLIMEEMSVAESHSQAEPVTAREHQSDVLPSERRIVRLAGRLAHLMPSGSDDTDPIAKVLDELRQERAMRFAEGTPPLQEGSES